MRLTKNERRSLIILLTVIAAALFAVGEIQTHCCTWISIVSYAWMGLVCLCQIVPDERSKR